MNVCYCSTLGDCWELTNPWNGSPESTTPVPECRPDPVPFTTYTHDQSAQLIDRYLEYLASKEDGGAAPDAAASTTPAKH